MKKIKKILLATTLLMLIMLTIPSLGSQEKDIYLNTGGKTGHLIYEESYYSVANNNTTLDQTRRYFDGDINTSRITFLIVRPNDTNGKPYPESMIRAYATLNNKVILNTLYGSSPETSKVQGIGNAPLIGLVTIVIVILVVILVVTKTIKKLRNEVKEHD